MLHNSFHQLKQLWIGIVITLLVLVYGFGLGAAFGIAEDGIKGSLKASALEVSEAVYKGDKTEMSKVTDKSWTYFKRAHFHANGMGTASLVLIVVLSFLNRYNTVRVITALGLGIGAMGYSLFWMFAGMLAPGLGSTGLAKESLIWLSLPSVIMFISGTLSVIVIFLLDVLKPAVREREGSLI